MKRTGRRLGSASPTTSVVSVAKSLARRGSALMAAGILLAASVLPGPTYAANPDSGTVSQANPSVIWIGTVKPATGSANCSGPNNASCDNFRLSIIPPAASFGPYEVEIRLSPALVGDWDLQVYGPAGTLLSGSGNSPGQVEVIILGNPPAGTYTVAAAPFAPAAGPDLDGDALPDSYDAVARIQPQQTNPTPPGGEDISYAIHMAPSPEGRSAAEPSCGTNHNTDRVMFIADLETLRVSFDDCSSPAKATWEDVSFVTTTTVPTLDPILFTDSKTGRTFVSQLAGKTSRMAFSDDDGATWLPSQGGGINSGVDHQTVGGGRFQGDLERDPNGPLYPHAVYYCSQDLVTAQCARSDTGGATFGPAVPIYNTTECGGLHGAVKVAPDDGTVYVPNKGCDGVQAVVVSEDNGVTWEVRKVPPSRTFEWDPSAGIARDGTVYFGYGDGDGRPKAAVSFDHGRTWPIDGHVAEHLGIKHTAFPVMVAGDRLRAAFAFLGSAEPSPGAGGDDPDWPGDWHVFISHTYDGGLTWTTINATPNDPVQRGTICAGGFGGCDNGTRNLLDFMDSDIDREGRVVVAYADGCIGDCVVKRPNSFTDIATVARQVNGRRLFPEFDGPAVPVAPQVSATRDSGNPALVHLAWSRPDDRGSPITGYKIYRRVDEGSFALLASVGADVQAHDDTTNPDQQYAYRVTATNAIGEGPACGDLSVAPPPDPCKEPGPKVLTDGAGDATGGQPEHDVLSLSISEPADLGPGKVVFTLKMASMANPPPDTTWPVVFRTPDGTGRFVRMATSATGAVSFASGTGTNPSPFADAGTPADPASGFSADGTIRIVVARSNIGSPAPGSQLTQFLTRIRIELGPLGFVSPDNMPQNFMGDGSYNVVGSETCFGCDPPSAADDAATTIENNPVVIDVLANDSNPAGDPLTVMAITQPANGSATNNGDGTVTYRPHVGFHANDSFTYTVRNACGLTDTATVIVTVNPFCPLVPTGRFFDDLEPGAEQGWQVDTVENNLGPLSPTWQVLADPNANSPGNSFFSDATTLDLKDDRLVAPPQDLSSTSRLIFWHRFLFEETFDGGVLEVSTNGGATWVDVLTGGGAFLQGGYNGAIQTGFGSPIAGRQAWTGGFLDAVLAPMEKVVVDLSAYAGFDVRMRWRLTADPLAIGSVPGHGWWIDDVEFTNTLVLSNCNRPPIANDDEAGTERNMAVDISVLANDIDQDADPLTVSGVTRPANGSAAVNPDGRTVRYAPNQDFLGNDSFTYTASDGQGHSDTATVTVTVTEGPNSQPDAVDDSAATQEETPVAINVLANDSDPDGDPLEVTDVSDPPNGSAIADAGGKVTYTPDRGFFGADSFAYTIRDGRGGSDSAMVNVMVTEGPNEPPDAVDDSAATQENTAVTINVVANDSDPDGDSLTVTAVTQPGNGTATNNGDGTVTYTPNSGFTGADSFTYTIGDGNGGFDTATVTVVVNRTPTPTGGKVTGGGRIPGSGADARSNFGFNAQVQEGAKGRISYDGDNGGVSLKGVVHALHIEGSQADFSGSCTLGSGSACTFAVQVEDNDDPGAGADRFSIQVFDASGATVHSADGILGGGNIQVHP